MLLLEAQLGPTYPWLIDIAKEPLPFQRQRFALCYDPTIARIVISARSIPAHAEISAQAERLPITTF